MHKGKTKSFKATALSTAVKSALALGLAPGLVFAQTDDSNDELLETITVTGSRIPRLDPQLVTPVQVYDAEFIKNTGAGSVQDFLFQASFAGPALFNENQTLSQTAGTANFDSRGFGDDYVVILLNGRRLPADPLGGDSATNLNLVPIGAVERIEYLSTGASAIYGADAVQGVINVITKMNYEGLDGSIRYDNTFDNDGSRIGVAITGGVVSDKGFITVSVDYQKQDDVDAAGLPLIGSASAPGADGRSPTGLPGTYLDFGPNFTAVPVDGCPAESVRTDSYGLGGTECAFDFAPLYDAVPAMERTNLLINGEYRVSQMVTAYGEFRTSRNVTEVRNGAAPAFFQISGAAFLTEVDAQLYKLALGEFMAKIAWLESDAALGRRVLCDDVLDRWEPELAYMNVSVTELYSVVSGIASGSASDADSSGVDWMFDEVPVCNPIQTTSAQCTQVNNLGRADTPLECARRMANFSYCGDLFLFSTAHPERGCQCCSLGAQNESATGNEQEWAMYSAAECTAQDAPSSHRRD